MTEERDRSYRTLEALIPRILELLQGPQERVMMTLSLTTDEAVEGFLWAKNAKGFYYPTVR